MIYLGNNKIGSIYSGGNKIDKIYKGEELVYSSGLPKGTIFNFVYTGAVQELELPSGNYLLEVWGASSSGRGGYSKGVLNLKENTILNCYCGGATSVKAGGFNGGGGGGYNANGGGGGTDIRINSTSLYSRVIVAGGGGGNGYGHTYSGAGGSGGGLVGGDGEKGQYSGGRGATQTSGFSFGIGQTYNGGGGGGGWYGASSGWLGSGPSGGGGGSGYIHTPDSHKPEGWLLTEEHYLTEAETIAGDKIIPKPSGGTQTGHTGSGYARITVV